MHVRRNLQTGFTLLEMLIALAIAATLLASLAGTVGRVLEVRDDSRTRSNATRDARFAMQRMVTAVRQSDRLVLPLPDNPNTNWREHVREQSVPAAPPEGSSALATAVLAVTLGAVLDRDEDGFADADNDEDGKVDEDVGADHSNDFAAGIIGIDDDGDGLVDESNDDDDDEDEDLTGSKDEDDFNGIDDDGDGAVDEDFGADMNDDGQSGIANVDDDGDGDIDESNTDDDDEDEDNLGDKDEDWLDPVVFFLSGATLMERLPDLNPSDGTDFTEYAIAEHVTFFRVERIASASVTLVDITLEMTLPGGEPTRLSTRVRVGGGL